MGGSVSSGRNNDELIDNLCDSSHIKTQKIESVFRAVDRAIYYLQSHKDVAYRDLAWREGNIHISAPCIYSEVMEALEIERGNSFLNIGSGTGYLSTMIGLILGPYGVNHNIEIHADVIDYAKARLNEFIKTSVKFDHFDFCLPKFINCNFLNIITHEETRLYDRIYVGTGVNDEHVDFIKNLLNINGVLVMPLDDYLVQIKRKGQNEYEKKAIMSVSFASYVNEKLVPNSVSLPKVNPLSLQELCRFRIRELIRNSIESSYPDYYKPKKRVKKVNNEGLHSESSSRYTRRFFLGRNTLTEAQFRLLIHGRLYERNYQNDDDDDEDDDEVEENEDRPEHNNNNHDAEINEIHDEIAAAIIQDEMAVQNANEVNENPNRNNQQQIADESEMVVQSSGDSNEKTSSLTIPIPQKESSVSESGFSESDQSSLDLANSLAKDIVVPTTSSNNETTASAMTNAVNIKPNTNSNDSINNTDFESVGSHDSCFFTDAASTSSSFNNFFYKKSSIDSDHSKSSENVNMQDESQTATANTTSTIETTTESLKPKTSASEETKKEENEPQEVYINHLRNRILQLEIPKSLKNFLLYNREI